MMRAISLLAGLIFLAACVTINIYFPAAEAKEAAGKIVEEILHPPVELEQMPTGDDHSMLMPETRPAQSDVLLDWLIPRAEADSAPKLDVDSPEIRRLQETLKQRHGMLKMLYEKGVIGFTQTGLVGIRKIDLVVLRDQAMVKSMVRSENLVREELYKEIAKENGHPEWTEQVRQVFAETWIEKADKGWWYQDSKGEWKQK